MFSQISFFRKGVSTMFLNRAPNGRNNLAGIVVARLRKEKGISQRKLAENLQLIGLDIDKNAVQRIESGQRFVTDIELMYLAEEFNLTYEQLLNIK